MRNWRYATTDEDIRPELIQSKVIKGLLGKYDAYSGGDGEIIFFDPYENFFFQMSDMSYQNTWEVNIGDYFNEDGTLKDDWHEVSGGVQMSVLRVVYITPHRRGQGRLRRIMEDLTSLSDETGESIGLFCDPFRISGYGRELTAYEAFLKFSENGYEQTEDWIKDLYYLRKKYMSYGFQNIVYDRAELTEGYQHFVYISANASEEERKILQALRVDYGFKRFDNIPETD